MSIKPRTIDNLGIEPSVRYAKDRALLDKRLIDESQWLPKRIEIPSTTPYLPAEAEFDILFSVGRTVPWALFSAPSNFSAQSQALFSHQVIPSLGGYEKLEANVEKLNSMQFPSDKNDEEDSEEKRRKRLLALFKCVEKLNRTLDLINARRNQYKKG